MVQDQGSDTALYRYAVHDRPGYIDAEGHVMIAPQFRFPVPSWISGFHGGVADVESRWIDEEGRPLPPLPRDSQGLRWASEGLTRTNRSRGASQSRGSLA